MLVLLEQRHSKETPVQSVSWRLSLQPVRSEQPAPELQGLALACCRAATSDAAAGSSRQVSCAQPAETLRHKYKLVIVSAKGRCEFLSKLRHCSKAEPPSWSAQILAGQQSTQVAHKLEAAACIEISSRPSIAGLGPECWAGPVPVVRCAGRCARRCTERCAGRCAGRPPDLPVPGSGTLCAGVPAAVPACLRCAELPARHLHVRGLARLSASLQQISSLTLNAFRVLEPPCVGLRAHLLPGRGRRRGCGHPQVSCPAVQRLCIAAQPWRCPADICFQLRNMHLCTEHICHAEISKA